jgi:DNA-binding transcriptional regulator YiaG
VAEGDRVRRGLNKQDPDVVRLVRIRKGYNMTQKKFAKTFGLHHVTLARWESGESTIPAPMRTLIGLMDAGAQTIFSLQRRAGVKRGSLI